MNANPVTAYPASWYPLCRSADLKVGRVLRIDAFGTSFALFRTHQQHIGALLSACSHMGADLSRGHVVGEHLRCPLHHWRYSPDGHCRHIPNYPSIPKRACQFALPCEEHYGIIFAFLGALPTFAFPHFDNDYGESDQSGQERVHMDHSRPSITDIDAPYEVLVANSFDEQHFAAVHDRQLLEPPSLSAHSPHHLSIRYRARVAGESIGDRLMRAAGIKTVDIAIHCYGGNTMLVYNRRTPNAILVAILPIHARRSRVFVATVLARHMGSRLQPLRHLQLAIAHQLTHAFLRPDMAILQNLDLRPRILLPDADATFLRWLRYWRALPRTSVPGSAHDITTTPSPLLAARLPDPAQNHAPAQMNHWEQA